MLERRTVSSIRYPTAMKKMQMPELAQSWNQKLLNAGMPVPIISMLGILLTFTIFFMVEKNISSHFCLTSCQELLSPARYHRKKASNIWKLRSIFLGKKYLKSLMQIRIWDPESFWPWIRGPGLKKFGSGILVNIWIRNTAFILLKHKFLLNRRPWELKEQRSREVWSSMQVQYRSFGEKQTGRTVLVLWSKIWKKSENNTKNSRIKFLVVLLILFVNNR